VYHALGRIAWADRDAGCVINPWISRESRVDLRPWKLGGGEPRHLDQRRRRAAATRRKELPAPTLFTRLARRRCLRQVDVDAADVRPSGADGGAVQRFLEVSRTTWRRLRPRRRPMPATVAVGTAPAVMAGDEQQPRRAPSMAEPPARNCAPGLGLPSWGAEF